MSQFFKTQEETKTWLDEMGIKGYIINDDLNVDVDGDVWVCGKGLTHFPVQFGVIGGGFDCSENMLTTLEGAPQNVGKDFDCGVNHLTSLEGAPKEVGGDFDCAYNHLTSLEGAPNVVEGSFYCNGNQLTSLECAPEHVGENFYCNHNQLTSLNGTYMIGGRFYCSNNNLTTLLKGPEVVEGSYDCENNHLTSLDGIPTGLTDDESYVRGKVYCGGNPIRDVGAFRDHKGGFEGPSTQEVETNKAIYEREMLRATASAATTQTPPARNQSRAM